MKLRLLVVAVGSLICTSAFASANSNFDGFYAGGRVGGLATNAKIQNDSSATFINQYDDENQVNSSASNNIWNNSLAGDAFVGYGKRMNNSNFYLSGEVFAELGQPEATLNQSSYHQQPNDDEDNETLSTSSKVSLGHVGFGVDFRPGYLIDSNTLVYGRIGAVVNRETINSNDVFSFDDLQGEIITNNVLNASRTRDVVGVRFGLGAERRINSNLSATIDYVYTDYGRVSARGVGDINTTVDGDPDTVPGGFLNNASGTLATQALMVGLKYNFNVG
jgi:opacity protein-like surface antigen